MAVWWSFKCECDVRTMSEVTSRSTWETTSRGDRPRHVAPGVARRESYAVRLSIVASSLECYGRYPALMRYGERIASSTLWSYGVQTPGYVRSSNIPFELARGIFGLSIGAEFVGSPTNCSVSQCSIALPSASIL
jgi:hypothetical protein